MPTVRTRIRRPAPVSETLEQLGERIRTARIEAGLSQAQLGAPHFTRAYVSAIELGKVRPAMKSLEFMADKLNKPVSFFVEDEGADRRRRERAAVIARSAQLVAEGNAVEAIDILVSIVRQAQTPVERAVLQRSLGRAYTQARRGPEAIEVLGDALRVFTSSNDPEQIARTRAQLGAALLAIPSYAEAASELEAALTWMSKADVKDPLLKVHTIYNLGVTFYMRGDFRAAVLQFERAQREGSDVGDLRWEAGLYAGMGMSHLELHDYEAAVMYLRRSETLFEAIHNKKRAIESRFQAALSLRAMGQRPKAAELLLSALTDARNGGDDRLAAHIGSFGAVHSAEDGRQEEAVTGASAAHETAIRLDDPFLTVLTGLNHAKVLRKSDPQKAERILRGLIALTEKQRIGVNFSEVYTELSDLLAEGGLSEEALGYSRKAYNLERRK